jgi:hypothetical protein
MGWLSCLVSDSLQEKGIPGWVPSLFGSDKRFLCQALPVPVLVFLHEHLAEVIAKYQCSLKQESKANDAEFFIAT